MGRFLDRVTSAFRSRPFVPFLFFAGSAAMMATSASMPYRTSELVHVAQAGERPAADGSFHVGDLVWDTAAFAHDEHFEPLRAFFREHCDGRTGAAAAVCVSDTFARAFDRGTPHRELFDPVYEPVADLHAHMNGEPGHCVTRSGLIAATLLSMGIPAKVVQLFSPNGAGHTIVSVWDSTQKWLVFDPSFSVFLGVDGHRAGADAIANAATLVPEPAGIAPGGGSEVADGVYSNFRGPGLMVVFPEPWLYMRIGKRAAHPPLRARMAVVGATRFWYGPAQDVARAGFMAFGLLGIASLVASRARAWTATRAGTTPEKAAAAE